MVTDDGAASREECQSFRNGRCQTFRNPQQRQSGPVDRTILCHDCEARFQVIDKRAVESLRIETVPWLPNGVHKLPGADARSIKLYFMHVLWRSHASALPEMVGIDLSEVGRASRLRNLLFADDPGGPGDFAVNLARFDRDPDGLDGVIAVPTRIQWAPNRASAYSLHIGRWWVTVTVAAGGPPFPFRTFTVEPGNEVPVIVGGAFRDSAFFSYLIEAVRNRRR